LLQRILDEIARQLDDYEIRYGLIDRKEFDGEFFVPQEVRNRVYASKGSLRIHGGLLTLSRSRTFLSLSSGNRSSIHSSTPDLRSTPGSNHKLSLTSSYDSVLEENEENGVIVIKQGKTKSKKVKAKHVQHIFSGNVSSFGGTPNQNQLRRKSEDLLESLQGSSDVSSLIAVQKQQQHVRQSSEQAFRLIPRVKQNVDVIEKSSFSASTEKFNGGTAKTQWGNIQGSNSFTSDLNISSLSTYTIPRVSLSHHNILNEAVRTPLPGGRILSTFIMCHDTDDSAA
jgi:hypothetical protein